MNFFVCLLDLSGRGIPSTVRESFELVPKSRRLPFTWRYGAGAAVLMVDGGGDGSPALVCEDSVLAVGAVRLDNRSDLLRWSASRSVESTDLALIMRTVVQHGTRYLPQVLGDFAFVVWDANARKGVAACDAFGVKKLFYTERDGFLVFASRCEALADGCEYNVQYLAELVSACSPSPGLTVYAGIHAIAGGTLMALSPGRLLTEQYWSPFDCNLNHHPAYTESEAADVCVRLFADAVRLRMGPGVTWAQLSGGMDSSSVVSVVQWLAERGEIGQGLAGTVTYVDAHGTGGDERRYSDAVVTKWGINNSLIVDPPIWLDEDDPPPLLDQPSVGLMFYPRDRRLIKAVCDGNGSVLLTGVGGDNLFAGNMFFFADMITDGEVWAAIREMARRAAAGRVSMWELAYRNAVLPLLPQSVQQPLVHDPGQKPAWVLKETARHFGLGGRASAALSYAGRKGSKYYDALAVAVGGVANSLSYEVIEERLDVRHPFLYRPLVEFALNLPPELCVRPHARKWLLRESMRGIVPDEVLRRIGKGTPDGHLSWSLSAQRELLSALVENPVLGDLGIIEVSKLREAFRSAPQRSDSRDNLHGAVQNTLAIEAWLQMRSGRWPPQRRRQGLYSNSIQ